jgi:hypothetical protein
MVHFYRNLMRAVPAGKVREVLALLKAVHAQEDREAARAKAEQVVAKLEGLRLGKAAELVRGGILETLAYMAFPREHWTPQAKDTSCHTGEILRGAAYNQRAGPLATGTVVPGAAATCHAGGVLMSQHRTDGIPPRAPQR